MIGKILIANRGEIACRIARTCAALGIRSAGIYSSSDFSSAQRSFCDEAHFVPGKSVQETYLDVEKIIEIAKRCGAEGIHPGFGFLSENAEFAEACIAAGLTWVGPSPKIIRTLGDKISAKTTAIQAEMPTLPQCTIPESEEEARSTIVSFLETASGPILLKAAAGGGGRGMRILEPGQSDIADQIAQARKEAKKFFGDATLFAEKYVAQAKHVEVQIIGDQHGNARHLWERDCSLQRRHQKIIEESPAPGFEKGFRSEICSAAEKLAKKIEYDNAGTVEFIVDQDGSFYFLEVNTRLQVEHPVTEGLLDIDLVELQIRSAAGENLGEVFDAIAPPRDERHVMEFRICSESEDFVPQRGQVRSRFLPQGVNARIDHGLNLGAEITTDFDSMVAKLIVSAPSRDKCIEDAKEYLQQFCIAGATLNTGTHLKWLNDERFINASHYTALLDETRDADTRRARDTQAFLVACAVVSEYLPRHSSLGSEGILLRRTLVLGSERIDFTCSAQSSTLLSAEFVFREEATTSRLVIEPISQSENSITFLLDGTLLSAKMVRIGDELTISSALGHFCFSLGFPSLERGDASGASATGVVCADLPGRVTEVKAAVGDTTEKEQIVVVLESMKMEHPLRAPIAGTIGEISCSVDDVVAAGQRLFQILPPSS